MPKILNGLHIFIFLITLQNVNLKLSLKVKNLECSPGELYRNISCTLKAISWKKTLVNINATLNKDIHSATIHGQIFKRYSTYQPFLVNVTFEFCTLVDTKQNPFYFTKFLRTLMYRHTGFRHKCPYLKDEFLFAQNLDFNLFDFFDISTGSIAAGRYRININIYINGLKELAAFIVGHADVMDD